MKRVLGVMLGALVFLTVLGSAPALAYNDYTHRQIASQGIVLIRNSDDPRIRAYASDLYKPFNVVKNRRIVSMTPAQILMDFSTQPDKDETSGWYEGHFYSPTFGTNYRGNRYPTARSNFTEHYNKALTQYRKGCYEQAWQELGRAIHYLGDLHAPHHVWNFPFGGNGVKESIKCHSTLESYYDGRAGFYVATCINQDELRQICSNNLDSEAHRWAAITEKSSYYLGTMEFDKLKAKEQKPAFERMAGPCSIVAQQRAAAVYLRFLNDVGIYH
ncbi:phospholipase C zinc-binding protein [Syntrophothermus lipocalidus]|uniref:Phospholipase C zinc-binding protein n=1 Tax=Syntrophothermus lipocalidus (strain DSM 12680 / TGB-C1) TaxID=643648 RepID=D7CIG5_SYNLT|nr:phospholipase C zinc-binding protein [Syntrophothermus lipocalidus]ADI00830.1 phospholipase C zinc-binding protein [Syntrophothermus lipocalidus DSM 12680]